MRGLSWNRTSKDFIILEEMRDYVILKNGCYCMFPNIKITVNTSNPNKILVEIIAKTVFKEHMVYYGLCKIAQDYGVYAC